MPGKSSQRIQCTHKKKVKIVFKFCELELKPPLKWKRKPLYKLNCLETKLTLLAIDSIFRLGFLWRVKSMQMQSARRHKHTHAIPLYYNGILLFN